MIISSPYSCGCRGCGEVIPAHTQIVMTSRGPFHVACASAAESEPPEFELQFGGKLVVSEARVGVEYAFPGPDRRYRWSRFFVPFSDLLETSKAIRSNWDEYEQLRKRVVYGDTIEKRGSLGMTIRVSLLEPGVWLFRRYVGVCNPEQAVRLSSEYEAAFQRLQGLSQLRD